MFALNSLRAAVLLTLGAQALAQEPVPPTPVPHAPEAPVAASAPVPPAARHEPSFSLDSATPGLAGGEASAAAAALARNSAR